MGNILIKKFSSQKISASLDLKNNFVHLPNLFSKKVVVCLIQQVMLPAIAAAATEISFGNTEATPVFSWKSDLVVTPAMNQLEAGRTAMQVSNPNAHTFTINPGAVVVNFKYLNLENLAKCDPCR